MKKFFSKGVLISLFAAFVVFTTAFAINSMKKHVTLVVDGKEQVIDTYVTTVADFLAENGITIDSKDKIDKGNEEDLAKQDRIVITRAVPVVLYADGAIQEFMTAEKTVEDFLNAESVTLGEIDKISVPTETLVSRDMEITIVRVTKEMVTENVTIAFGVQEKKDASIMKGTKKVTQEGSAGEKVLTKERTYEDGVLVSEELVGENVTKSPVDKIVAVGTKVMSYAAVNTATRGPLPESLSYSSTYTVRATAYAGDGITASGAVPVRNPSGWSTIAVDRTKIPLGTRVYVEGYGYAIAQDVGGAIKGDRIDVFMNSESDCIRWGVKYVRIYILD
ncbi:G5 and 3D domain-containing protein [Youngiibacter multivorans]|uniref:Uncharacterized protein YabE (DUF348 family) n=1 Tax=Youngiibacter multivorans TaxID=937251 RepID=A0ABS4G2E3_9CLOT|nr:G5 and 3D domain-containing protein [Youngiibacter multivorans]MBP1918716.1 uncharacterized protein YabE (DUF348 family) [Youngiibacter multivorans]